MFEKELTNYEIARLYKIYHEERYEGKPTYSLEDFVRILRTTSWTMVDEGDGVQLWDADDIEIYACVDRVDGTIELDAGE